MPKPLCKVEFNFDTMTTEESLSSKLSVISEKIKVIPSPWTGNKRKIVSNIIMLFSKHNIPFDSVLDLFCGSASMSAAFRMLGAKVFANDLLLFPYYNACSFLHDYSNLVSNNDIKEVFESGDNAVRFIRDKFKDRFTKTEAEKIDRFISGSKKITDIPKKIIYSMSMLYHIMKHCYVGGRLNKGQVLAKLDHRLEHSRNDGKEMGFNLEWNGISYDNPLLPDIHNMDASIFLSSVKPNVQTAYIDPPYGGDQSDYAKMYEFFEEYLSYVFDIYREVDYAKFASKKGYHEHFEKLLDTSKYIPNLVFSYNNSSWCPIEEIVSIIKKFRSSVQVEELDYDYKYRSSSKDNSKEYIIISKRAINEY